MTEGGISTTSTVHADHDLHCEQMVNPKMIGLARRLVASIYLDEGYVLPDEICPEGALHDHVDPHHRHSDYFAVGVGPTMEPLVAVSRLVRHDDAAAARSFPMLCGMTLDPEFDATIAAADMSSWVEVGSMAKVPGASVQAPNLLYRVMWQRAVRERHTTWLFAADHRVSRTLRNLFGEEVTSIGPRQHFMGSPTDPLIMHPPTSADWLARQAVAAEGDDSVVAQLVRLALAFFLDGLEAEHFTEEQLELFAAGGVELRGEAVLDLRDGQETIDLVQ